MNEELGQLVEITAGGVRWQVRPEYRDCLVGPTGLRLDEWLRGGQARVIKHGPHRTVYHVALPGLDFYLKHYRLTDLRAWLRQAIRPAKARMEYDRALAVAARQLPTITPLGLGVGCAGSGPAESFLVTRGLENVEPLNVFVERTLPSFERPRQARIRCRLARELGELIARMHNAGIVHHDLHAANLLIGLENDDRLRLFLIDLHAVHLGRMLAWPTTRGNLVVLNRWFMLRASRADRLRFWRAYCRERQKAAEASSVFRSPLGVVLDDMARDLEQRTWISNQRFWRHRDKRCLTTNRYYERVQGAATAGFTVRDLDPAVQAALFADPDEPFRRPGVILLKDSRSSTVAEFDLSLHGVVRRVIYKRFRVTSVSDPWTALVRPSPALRSWMHGHGLRERCLPTARPLAVLHRRRHGLPWEGYLLTEKIPNVVDLQRFLADLDELPSPERRAALRCRLDQVAHLVRELHRRNLSHRDLKAANVLVAPAGGSQPATPAVWLIDLVGVTKQRFLSRARRVQNLARLHASFHDDPALTRTDKLRFLSVYLQWGLVGRGGWKNWWRDIDRATQDKVERNLQRGRPLR